MNLRILISIALAVGIALSFALLLQDVQDTTRVLPERTGSEVTLDQFDGWSFYTSPDRVFTVLFPAEPMHTKKELTRPNRIQDVYLSEGRNGSIYTVTVITYQDRTLGQSPQMLMKSMLDEMLAGSPESELLLMREGIYRGHPSLEFALQNRGAQMDARAFAIGNVLYVLSYRAFAMTYRRAEFDYFAESFEVN